MNSDGSFTWTPPANFNGTDSFTYRASDGLLTSAITTVTLNVLPVNDPPVANDDSYSTSFNTPITIAAPGLLLNDRDVDGDPLTAVLATSPAARYAGTQSQRIFHMDSSGGFQRYGQLPVSDVGRYHALGGSDSHDHCDAAHTDAEILCRRCHGTAKLSVHS
jgi:hypothetical protein